MSKAKDSKTMSTKKKALAIYRDTADQKHVLVEVSFDPEDTENVTVLSKDVREDVLDRFKIKAAELYMGDL